MSNKNRYEIIIHGRGGQGAKTSAEMIAQAALHEGKFVQAFPEFGPERSGAPVRSFVRISDRPIRTREPIVHPDCVLVLDETLLANVPLSSGLENQTALIVNTRKTKRELALVINGKFNIIPVDASAIAKEIVGEDRPNVVILGKLVFITEIVKLEDLTAAFREKYSKKIGPERTEKNIRAMEKAYGA